ncbi:MAG TPA: shikimate kinase [Ottowia sp.]|nr:shikimate kinase [Ottowia sp.]
MMVVLVGMPGSGKSTVGRSLAHRMQLPFADSDAAIEQRLGCAIRDYFDREGEAAFRDVEQAVIDELTQGPPGVLATGGGAVLRPLNRQHLHERGTVIYLRSSPETLFRRLRHDTKRPLLQVDDPLARLRALYAERDPLYRQCAHFVLDTHGSSMSMLLGRIMMQLELMPPGDAAP